MEVKSNISEKVVIEHDKDEFPEGTVTGWLVVFAGWLSMCSVFGMVNSFGVYQTYYQTVLLPHEDPFKISLVGALQPFCIYLFAIPTVYLLHQFGARYTIAFGGLVQVFSLMMLSLTNELWQLFLTQGILFGFGSAIIYLSGLTIVLHWFKRRRAIAMGIVSSGSSLGGVFWPIAVKRLIDEVGIDWTNRILGFIYLPICGAMVLFFKPRLELTMFSSFGIHNLKNWKFVLLTLSFVLVNLGLFPGLFFIDLYGKRLGDKLNHEYFESTYYIAILNAMSLFGRVIPGFLAHRFGQTNVLIPFLTVAGITPLAMWLTSSNSNGLFLAFVIVWGFSTGTIVSLYPALLPQLFGIKDNQARMGLFFAIGGIGALFGPMICGSFIPYDNDGLDGLNKVPIFVGVMLLGGSGLLIVIRLVYSRSLETKI